MEEEGEEKRQERNLFSRRRGPPTMHLKLTPIDLERILSLSSVDGTGYGANSELILLNTSFSGNATGPGLSPCRFGETEREIS